MRLPIMQKKEEIFVFVSLDPGDRSCVDLFATHEHREAMLAGWIDIKLIPSCQPGFDFNQIIHRGSRESGALQKFRQNGNFFIKIDLPSVTDDFMGQGMNSRIHCRVRGSGGNSGRNATRKANPLSGKFVYHRTSRFFIAVTTKSCGSESVDYNKYDVHSATL